MDGLGQLPGALGAAAELTHDAPGLELGIGAFPRGTEPGMSPVGLLLRGGFVPFPVGRADGVLAEVALITQHDQARGGQLSHETYDAAESVPTQMERGWSVVANFKDDG